MRISYITLKEGERHPLCFSLTAAEALCDEFGDLGGMATAISDSSTGKKVRAISKVLGILMNAGRKYCQEIGVEMPPPLKCPVGDLIDITDRSAITAIFSTIEGDTKRTIEANSKNEQPTPEAS